jgi:hypothetical protein
VISAANPMPFIGIVIARIVLNVTTKGMNMTLEDQVKKILHQLDLIEARQKEVIQMLKSKRKQLKEMVAFKLDNGLELTEQEKVYNEGQF